MGETVDNTYEGKEYLQTITVDITGEVKCRCGQVGIPVNLPLTKATKTGITVQGQPVYRVENILIPPHDTWGQGWKCDLKVTANVQFFEDGNILSQDNYL